MEVAMQNKTTKWALAGAFLTVGMIFALALFACNDGSGGGGGGNTYTITKKAGFDPAKAHGDFTIDKPKAKEGETITLTLQPETKDYVLNRWSLTPTSLTSTVKAGKNNKYTFIMPAENVTVNVTFKTSGGGLYTITKESDFDPTNGDFTINPANANAGDTITLELAPVNGYEFSNWAFIPGTITATETLAGSGTYTFTMPASNVTVSAIFIDSNAQKFSITKAATFNPATAHGKFTINGGDSASVPEGTPINLVPEPDANYAFSVWIFNPPLAAAPVETPAGSGIYPFAMPPNDVTVSATFTSSTGGSGSQYTVIKHSAFSPATAHGDFTINESDSASVPPGTLITLKPTPESADYKFGSWTFNPSNLNATETPAGSGTYTFTTPTAGINVIINATFLPTKFTITKGAAANGSFTINGGTAATPLFVSDGETISLAATADGGYQFAAWGFVPPLTTTVPTSATGTFTMPANDLTVTAYFSSTNSQHIPGTGVKTMTVKGGMGKASAYPNAVTNGEMYDGTRDITVTVTMANNAITNVSFQDTIEWTSWYPTLVQNGNLRSNAQSLVNALNAAKNATASYNPNTTFTGNAVSAWNTYNTNIRKAVTDAVATINEGKPNRVLTGGGPSEIGGGQAAAWLVDGVPLNGTATAAGSGFMGGSTMPSGGNMAPTDMTVTVTVTNGFITDITVTSDDMQCSYGSNTQMPGGNTRNSFPIWIESIKTANNMLVVDTVSSASANATPFKAVSERFLKQIGQRAFMKIVNEY